MLVPDSANPDAEGSSILIWDTGLDKQFNIFIAICDMFSFHFF